MKNISIFLTLICLISSNTYGMNTTKEGNTSKQSKTTCLITLKDEVNFSFELVEKLSQFIPPVKLNFKKQKDRLNALKAGIINDLPLGREFCLALLKLKALEKVQYHPDGLLELALNKETYEQRKIIALASKFTNIIDTYDLDASLAEYDAEKQQLEILEQRLTDLE